MNETIDDVRHAVNTIEKRSKGLLTFIENYRELTRIPKPEFKMVKIKDLFERVDHLMKDQFERCSIKFNMQIDPISLEITADPALIEQVLINLCKNALEAVNGVEGIEAAAREQPDLILMDIQMPEMDGYEATRRIKAEPTTAAIPVIAVTSYALSGDEDKAKAAGCDGYVTKPFSPRALLATVRTWLG